MTPPLTLIEVVSADVTSMEECIRGKLSGTQNKASRPHRFRYLVNMEEHFPDTAGSDEAALATIGEDSGDYVTIIDPLDVVGISSTRLREILVHEIVHHIVTVVEPDPDRPGKFRVKTTIDHNHDSFKGKESEIAAAVRSCTG